MEKAVSITLTHAVDIFSEHLTEIKQAMQDNIIADVDAIPVPEHTDNEALAWVRKEVYTYQIQRVVEPRNRVIKRIAALLTPRTVGSTRITDDDIARAREFPIEELYDGRLFKSGGKSKCGLCPFHVEKTPSFHIYKDNRYKCFGCQEYGDVIQFYMKQNNVKFIDAVKALTNK